MMTAQESPWHRQSLSQLGRALRAKQISASELAQYFLQRIKQSSDAQAAVFLARNEALTLQQAQAADARLSQGAATALTGLPLAWQDMLVTQDFVTTAASRMLADWQPPYDASVVSRLAAENVVQLGKLNGDEFGLGAAGRGSALGQPANPFDAARVPGGAASGVAVAVATGLAPAAIGVDSCGDLRQPAAFCGLTSLRPTYGRVSRHGVIAHVSSMDQAGPMARSAQDCALLLSAMAGADDAHDATSLKLPQQDFSRELQADVQGLRLGLPRAYFSPDLDAQMAAVLQEALQALEKLGLKLVPIDLPHAELAAGACDILAAAEAASNLARYDGVRFGHRADDYQDLDSMYRRSRAEGFGLRVKQGILSGTWFLNEAQYHSHYLQAQKVRRLVAQDFAAAWSECDLLAAPVSATAAWPVDAAAPQQAGRFTVPAALAGLPAMSLPAGQDAQGMPVGLQLMAAHLQESRLLSVAHQLQQATDFHCQAPEGFE